MGGNTVVRTTAENTHLIRYMMRHHHTSPFEMAELRFHLKIPVFVMRQHVRHRTASINEYSGRYSVMSDEFYLPETDRMQGQSTDNKQMSSGQLEWGVVNEIDTIMRDEFANAYHSYNRCLELGLSREIARIQLPLANYTELYWKIDLHNFFHYIGLRDDPSHAQAEIVKLAQIMYGMVKKKFPVSCQAFEDYKKNAVTFSSIEMKVLLDLLDSACHHDTQFKNHIFDASHHNLRGRELEEFKQKIFQKFEDTTNE